MMLETSIMSFWLSVRNSPSFQSSPPPLTFTLPRNNLLERRIGYQESFQQTGLLRIGAAELERGWRAVCFRISRVECHFREDLVGQPNDWIETAEGEVAVDVGAGPEQIRHGDLGEVVTSARGQRQPIGDVECFISVEAVIRILCVKIDRAK